MWTFGICYSNHEYLESIIYSIKNQKNLNKFEIILIGPTNKNVSELLKNIKKI